MKEEIKDVMVGDWIDVRNNAAPNTQHLEKITPSHFLRDEHWYGVELVPEILEKNGFEKGRLNVSPQYYFEDNDVFIGVTLKDIPDKHKGIDIAKGKLYFQYDISYIEGPIYVHQLQHALRLCGIKKEIVL